MTLVSADLDGPGVALYGVVGDVCDGALGEGQGIKRVVRRDGPRELHVHTIRDAETRLLYVLRKAQDQ